ncbi:TVP38/TMEM64 family protein [Berryella wangjianweii]|uniref:TVP38/TMEM64 family membrane protein n=1 Tax=Berryella wangjianweii TaxID=2734634 RepID=A0A6M8J9H7_9ACTN|nr:TVP38/TMEM64 family protein [Berryella wangjianweii]QKF07462.1 TVP38/TMEM64 family protein [Berryella wangjianweii]
MTQSHQQDPNIAPTPKGEVRPAARPSSVQLDEAFRPDEAVESPAVATPAGKRGIERDDVVRFAALLGIAVACVAATVLLWPNIMDLFSEGGVERLVEQVRGAGPWGVAILLGMQLLQIIVAFIPGEVVQVAAGLMYGPWWGALIILIGAALSSAIVYEMVHRLGAPFVQKMVPEKYLNQIRRFEESSKFEVVVFVLFLIPGLPKDAFTYLLPLTSIRIRPFLLITTIARAPGVLASTFAAAGFADGNLGMSIAVIVVVGGIALVGILFQDRVVDLVDRVMRRMCAAKGDEGR